MSLLENLNKLNKNISEEAVEQNNILDATKEFKKVIGAKESDDNTLDELIAEIAEELPEKIGGGGGITVNESYDISEGTLNTATVTLEGDVVAHIPDGVATIGEQAFMTSPYITKVIIPDSVTSIGNHAFDNCRSLTSITIPDSVTSIEGYAFDWCTSLTSITIPDSVTSIGDGVFDNCQSLTSITIPDSVTSIGRSAFDNCRSLTSITIPDSVTSIGDYAFVWCTSLTSITIPDSVTSIGERALDDCSNLTDIYYTGKQAKWEAITGIGSAGIPAGATIHYNYTPN